MANAKGNFNNATRLKYQTLATITKPTGGGSVSVQLPKTGLLRGISLAIRATISGSLSAPNALGLSSIIRRVRVQANSGIDIFNVTGPGYVWGLQEMLESGYFLNNVSNVGRSAVTVSSNNNLDMYIPIQVNSANPYGLLLLQNESTVVTLTIEFESDAVVATGATVTCTVVPTMEFFTVPVDPKDYPDLSVVHQILEESQVISAAGEVNYQIPKGNTYLQLIHGLGWGVSGSDLFTQYRLRVNQSDYIMDVLPNYLSELHNRQRGRVRPAGGIYVDLLGSAGLGTFGTTRDIFNTRLVTDFSSVINASGSGTLYTIRRQFLFLQ